MNRDTRIQKLREAIAAQLGDAYYPTIEGAEAILDAVFEEANTPTDDEDRALAWAEYRKDYEPNPAHFGREHVAFFAGWDAREGFHRTVQGEPTDPEGYGASPWREIQAAKVLLTEAYGPGAWVQGEPPEAAVSAAGEVLYGISWGTDLADPDLVRRERARMRERGSHERGLR